MLLSYSQVLLRLGECQCSNTLGAFNTLDVALRFIFDIIDDYVVARRVDDLVLVEKVNIILHVSLQSCYELRYEDDILLGRFALAFFLLSVTRTGIDFLFRLLHLSNL